LTEPPIERRGISPNQIRFRATVDRLLTLAESLPEEPTDRDLEPIRQLVVSMRDEFNGDPELEHRVRNILTVTTLSLRFAGPGEAVQWIKEAVRGPVAD
jgi:hypothetical protein